MSNNSPYNNSFTFELSRVPTLEILNEIRRRYRVLAKPNRYVSILGSPGVGKSTLAGDIAKNANLCVFAPKEGMDKKKMYEELRIMSETVQCRKGFIFDNFPKTETEHHELSKFLEQTTPTHSEHRVRGGNVGGLDTVIILHSENEGECKKRYSGKLVHESSGRVYHEKNESYTPDEPMVDNITYRPLVRMTDGDLTKAENLSKWTDRWNSWTKASVKLIPFFRRQKFTELIIADEKYDVNKIILDLFEKKVEKEGQ